MSDFDYQQLDDVIHSRIRLAIMALLVSVDSATFVYIRDQVKTSDGNLSVHIRRLELAGYVKVHKKFVDRKPMSSFRLSAKGRRAFEAYVEQLESLLIK